MEPFDLRGRARRVSVLILVLPFNPRLSLGLHSRIRFIPAYERQMRKGEHSLHVVLETVMISVSSSL